jgi:hypothetical protein
MNDESKIRPSGVMWGWKEEFIRQAYELEEWIDRVASCLGDAIFGEQTAEKLFGPHPRRH